MISVKRVYEPAEPTDGARYLVDRLWPRGIRKEDLKIEAWLKDVAPSNELRNWFHHDLPKWDEFKGRYFAELDSKPNAWHPLMEAAKHGKVTLLYSARDEQHNNAVALQEFLEKQGVKN